MISVTKLLGGASYFGDRLRYDKQSATQRSGARPGSGPVVVWNATDGQVQRMGLDADGLKALNPDARVKRRRALGGTPTAVRHDGAKRRL